MDVLPPEVWGRVFGLLDPPSLARACCVCKGASSYSHAAWRELGTQESVWAFVAERHQYTARGERSVQRALQRYYYGAEHASAAAYFDEVRSFGDLCRKRHTLDTLWGTNAAPALDTTRDTLELRPQIDYYRPSGSLEDVWRIKIEYVSHVHGGVRTLDIHSGEVLWRHEPPDARPFPHLEFSDGWLVFDRDAPGHFEVWRSARLVPDAHEAHRGEYIRYTILDVPEMVRAYRMQFPTLAFEMDVPSKTLTRTVPLANTLHQHRNVSYIEFDDEHIFLVGFGFNRVSILHRDSGEVVWTLADHIKERGVPDCYRAAPLRTDDRHALLLRQQVQVRPPRWVSYLAHWSPRDPTQLCYSWHAVHPDRDTETLVALGESCILLIPKYKAMLRGEEVPNMRMYLLQSERDSRIFDEYEPEELAEALRHRRRPRQDSSGQLSVANGRVAAVVESLTVLDLNVPTLGRTNDGEPIQVPFAAYEWSDQPNAFDWYTGPIDQFRGCSCVQMDATGIYCVTRQALEREVGVAPDDFPPEYQQEAMRQDSSMVTGFHFDDRAKPPKALEKKSIVKQVLMPYPDPMEAWETETESWSQSV